MSPTRSWQRDLDQQEARVLEEQATARARVVAESVPPMATGSMTMDNYVRLSFDGKIGRHTLPFLSQHSAIALILQAATTRLGCPLSFRERVQLELAVTLEWNRRDPAAIAEREATERKAAAYDDRRRRGEWLSEFQEGHAS